ncbi:MAG: hypothetical protein Q9212_006625 [Teloschistes hypoglaucus]
MHPQPLLSFLFFLLPSLTLGLPSNTTTSKNDKNNLPALNCRGSFYCFLYVRNFINVAYIMATTGLDHPPPIPIPSDPNGPFHFPAPGRFLSESESKSAWNPGPINSSALYAGSSHVLCHPIGGGGFCVFAQGMKAEGGKAYVSGAQVKRGLENLVHYGCRMCGSVALEDVGDARADGGYLTVNYVSGTVCQGVCPESRSE